MIHGKPIVQYNANDWAASPHTVEFLRYLNKLIRENRTNKVAELAGYLTNAKYVVLQNYAENAEKELFMQQEGLAIVRQDENWIVLKNEYFRPHFTLTSRPIILFGDLDALLSLMYVDTFDTSSGAVFFANQIDNELLGEIKELDPLLIFYGTRGNTISSLPETIADENWEGWENGKWWPPGEVQQPPTVVSDPVMKGLHSLKIDVDNPTPDTNAYILRTFDQPRDWSNYEFLSFYWHGSNTSKRIRVILRDVNKNQMIYYFNDDWVGWRRVSLPLDRPNESYGNFNWMRVNTLFFNFWWGGTHTFYLDEIMVEGPNPYLVLNIDGQEKSIIYATSSQFQWVDTQLIYLDEGPHQISIQAVGTLGFDTFSIFSDAKENFLGIFEMDNDSYVESAEMLDSSNYTIKVEARKPFILVFHEAYDPNWVAVVDDNPLSSKLSYYCFNAFIIEPNESGECTVELSYTKQHEVVTLWKISFLALLICYLPLFWGFRKGSRNFKKEKGTLGKG